MRRGSFTTGTRLLVLVGMTFLLCLLSDGRRSEGLGIPSLHPGCHHVPVTMQPKFQQSFLFLFCRYPRFSSRSECRTFQLSAQLATWWCKLRRKWLGFSKRSSWFSFRAMLGSTVDTCSASAPGCFWTFFLRVGGTRLLKSTLSCSSVCGHARRRSSTNKSTRMELTAAIIATYAPRPITIAIDNQAFFKGFRIKDRRDKPTRWINKPDGDLWQFCEKAIVARGS